MKLRCWFLALCWAVSLSQPIGDPLLRGRCATVRTIVGRVVDATDCADPMTLKRSPCIAATMNATNVVDSSLSTEWAVCAARFAALPPPVGAACASYQPPLGAIASVIIALPVAATIEAYDLTSGGGGASSDPSQWFFSALDPGATPLTDAQVIAALPTQWIPIDNRSAEVFTSRLQRRTFALRQPVCV